MENINNCLIVAVIDQILFKKKVQLKYISMKDYQC